MGKHTQRKLQFNQTITRKTDEFGQSEFNMSHAEHKNPVPNGSPLHVIGTYSTVYVMTPRGVTIDDKTGRPNGHEYYVIVIGVS